MGNDQIQHNKEAWQHRSYEFFLNRYGTPVEEAKRIKQDPNYAIRLHSDYLPPLSGLKIANPCGSHGRIATALAVLGADVTVFDISEENQKYATELASQAGVSLNYVVGDFCSLDKDRYTGFFDLVLAELGIMHYFHEIDLFSQTVSSLLHDSGRFVLADFHPFRKLQANSITNGNYFDSQVHMGPVPYQKFFSEEEQVSFPQCLLRIYTIGEIINSLIQANLMIEKFDEHPDWDNSEIPGWYHLQAIKTSRL
ncbi:MAG: class I SAM-dependent methyltransferase [Lachnospiraceae bacterium]|nr:class I SAM-dependent methyltransferase [Lachnospiraceae bacterium]